MVKLRSTNGPPTVDRFFSAASYAQLQIQAESTKLANLQNFVLNGVFTYWNKLVENFSNRELTNPSDRLPAMHGLAQALHKSHIQGDGFLNEYSHEHWIRDFLRSLLWHAVSREWCQFPQQIMHHHGPGLRTTRESGFFQTFRRLVRSSMK
jgi:hypothetical protein